MKRVRARLSEWTPLAIALFVASIASPRAGLYFHHHADGDHAHVHDEGDEHDHALAAPDHHHHHGDLIAEPEQEPEIEAPDHDETGHWHAQSRVHRVVVPALAAADRVQFIEFVHVPGDHRAIDRPTPCAHARGPPFAA